MTFVKASAREEGILICLLHARNSPLALKVNAAHRTFPCIKSWRNVSCRQAHQDDLLRSALDPHTWRNRRERGGRNERGYCKAGRRALTELPPSPAARPPLVVQLSPLSFQASRCTHLQCRKASARSRIVPISVRRHCSQ